jgi:hypothetical protein
MLDDCAQSAAGCYGLCTRPCAPLTAIGCKRHRNMLRANRSARVRLEKLAAQPEGQAPAGGHAHRHHGPAARGAHPCACLAGAGRPGPAAVHHWCAAAWNVTCQQRSVSGRSCERCCCGRLQNDSAPNASCKSGRSIANSPLMDCTVWRAWSTAQVTEGRPVFALSGLVTAAAADTQLHAFCAANEARARQGASPKLVLDTGAPVPQPQLREGWQWSAQPHLPVTKSARQESWHDPEYVIDGACPSALPYPTPTLKLADT